MSAILFITASRPSHISNHSPALTSACVQQDTVVAIKQGGNDLTVSNMDDSKYPTATFGLDPKQVLADMVTSS